MPSPERLTPTAAARVDKSRPHAYFSLQLPLSLFTDRRMPRPCLISGSRMPD